MLLKSTSMTIWVNAALDYFDKRLKNVLTFFKAIGKQDTFYQYKSVIMFSYECKPQKEYLSKLWNWL